MILSAIVFPLPDVQASQEGKACRGRSGHPAGWCTFLCVQAYPLDHRRLLGQACLEGPR